jgi:hypothetical protein
VVQESRFRCQLPNSLHDDTTIAAGAEELVKLNIAEINQEGKRTDIKKYLIPHDRQAQRASQTSNTIPYTL